MVYGIYNELVTGANLNQQTYLTGASHSTVHCSEMGTGSGNK